MHATQIGTELAAYVHTMADQATLISLAATGHAKDLKGKVRLTASDALTTFVLPTWSIEFHQQHPLVHVELWPSNSNSDLSQREADIAVRHVRPQQPELIAKRLPDLEIGLFASEGYLEKEAIGPSSASDLARANFIAYNSPTMLIPQIRAFGIEADESNFNVTTTSGSAMFELVRAGAGCALLPLKLAASEQGIVQLLPKMPAFPMEIWLVTHREIQTNPRIRIVFDHLAAFFQPGLI